MDESSLEQKYIRCLKSYQTPYFMDKRTEFLILRYNLLQKNSEVCATLCKQAVYCMQYTLFF